ncbi:MAG: glycosyltransferase family 4 protein [Nanoarchaeota archaeon]
MKVLMFGWEFPPFSKGGLGTACHGLVKGLSGKGVNILLVLPSYDGDSQLSNVNIIAADKLKNIEVRKVKSLLAPYMTPGEYLTRYQTGDSKSKGIYGRNLFEEVDRFAAAAEEIAKSEQYDVIHAHDWLTYEAGIAAKKVSHKPLIVHVHATEFDRSGDNPNPHVYAVEKRGMEEADAIIAVSEYTKGKIVKNYGIPAEKITVVHNAIDQRPNVSYAPSKLRETDKIVLFLGRITLQKGPDYFLYAANIVSKRIPNVKFILAGTGDMEPFIIEKAVELGLADKVLFTGFLTGPDIDKAYQMADLYVMPSVSEPFGIVALEAMANGTPTLICKQSGVSEVIRNCLKADFWDVHDIAAKMISVLEHPALKETMQEEGSREVSKFSWNESSRKCEEIYARLLAARA